MFANMLNLDMDLVTKTKIILSILNSVEIRYILQLTFR